MPEVDLEKVRTILCDCFGDAFKLEDLEFELHKLVDEKFTAHRKAIQLADEVERLKELIAGRYQTGGRSEIDYQNEMARLRAAFGEAAYAAADEVREDCGESIAQRVFHAVKTVARKTIARAAVPKDEKPG